ncbi:MAG: heme exporter protein CcmB [Pseudomonadales bacterium]
MNPLIRECKILVRSPADTVQSVLFVVIVVMLFPLAISPDPTILAGIAAGLMWVVALLASLLAAERGIQADFADGALEQMVLGKTPLWLLCSIKAFAHWLSCGLPLLLITPLLGTMLALDGLEIFWMLASFALGLPILSLFCTLGAMLTVGLDRGSALLPLLIAPFLIPTLILGTQWVQSGGQSFYGYMLAALLSLSVVSLPLATGVAARIAVSR